MNETPTHDAERYADWPEPDLAELASLRAMNEALPNDAPRALLSVRLSVLTDETTSPQRTELDLWRLATLKGHRVVGVASDLGVSATKVPPWKRKSLGHWLNERAPEFDAVFFWKLDRFIRNLDDLNTMLRWCKDMQRNLVSKVEEIDLSTTVGRIIVQVIGGMAEIEATNTKTRVSSLWQYTKTQTAWNVGKPPYGYRVVKDIDGVKNTLAIEESQAEALGFCRDRLLDGASLSGIVREVKENGLMNQSITVATLKKRLSNPGLMGYRVQENRSGPHDGIRRSVLVLDNEGQPIRVGPEIFTKTEHEEIMSALEKRAKRQPGRNPNGATKMLGVLKCFDCGTNMTVQNFTKQPTKENRLKEARHYSYLRCQGCKNGGHGAPNPEQIYQSVTNRMLIILGKYPVIAREYARGEAMALNLC